MKNKFYCKDCKNEFKNVKWDGSQTVCPRCNSNRYVDIDENNYYHKDSKTPSEESPFP